MQSSSSSSSGANSPFRFQTMPATTPRSGNTPTTTRKPEEEPPVVHEDSAYSREAALVQLVNGGLSYEEALRFATSQVVESPQEREERELREALHASTLEPDATQVIETVSSPGKRTSQREKSQHPHSPENELTLNSGASAGEYDPDEALQRAIRASLGQELPPARDEFATNLQLALRLSRMSAETDPSRGAVASSSSSEEILDVSLSEEEGSESGDIDPRRELEEGLATVQSKMAAKEIDSIHRETIAVLVDDAAFSVQGERLDCRELLPEHVAALGECGFFRMVAEYAKCNEEGQKKTVLVELPPGMRQIPDALEKRGNHYYLAA